jgi:prepilin-type N-terminal cleavage/methylation domain-containing protein
LPRPARQRQTGFSLTELIVALVVAVILMAVALPMFLRAYNSYKLTNAARDVADILRLTRYEAIRLNKQVNCVLQQDTTDPTLTRGFMTDALGNALTGLSARNIILGNGGNLVDASTVPASGTLPALAKIGAIVPVNIPPGGGTIHFDQRGALLPPTVDAFYLASTAAPDAGFRAVLLMPAGSIQIWTADATGNWQPQR